MTNAPRRGVGQPRPVALEVLRLPGRPITCNGRPVDAAARVSAGPDPETGLGLDTRLACLRINPWKPKGVLPLSSQELTWGTPGVCPSCGVVTDHLWFAELKSTFIGPKRGEEVTHTVGGSQGWLLASRCLSPDCEGLAAWIRESSRAHIKGPTKMVYPLARLRTPPKDGLEPREAELYEEAAGVAPTSRRAASALLRVLLEAFLKRHLAAAGQPVKGKNLARLIEAAVDHLDLSRTMKEGLTAIRRRGNASVHDPYGLTDDARADDLPWLFQAVDDLVDDLHVKPTRWADISKT